MKFLLVSDTPIASTGLGKAMRHIGAELRQRGHEVAYAANLHDGAPHPEQPSPIWPWARYDGNQPTVARDLLDRAIRAWVPDQVILLGDAWDFCFLPDLRRIYAGIANRPGFLLYLTVDCAPFPLAVYETQVLEAADALACTTQLGVDVLSGRAEAPSTGRIHDLHYRAAAVPLGVDQSVYNHEGRDKVRAMFWAERPVLGWCGLNCACKHPGAALETLKHLRDGGVDAALLMKTQPDGQGGSIHEMCLHLGLRYSGEQQPGKAPDCDVYVNNVWQDERQLANFYRGLDVYLCTSSAGAPELPVLEARSCGVPAVAVDTSCFAEVANVVAEPKGHCWAQPNVVHEMPDPATLAQAVQYVLREGVEADAAGVPDWSVTVDGLLAACAGERAEWLAGITL